MTLTTIDNTFVVISEPRTGSTVFGHKLELLTDVNCQGEIFHPDEIFSSLKVESIPNLTERNLNPIDFLNKVFEQTYIQRGNSYIIGFKLFFDHNPAVTHHVLEKKIPIILLERRNKLAQYASLKIAKKTGKWNSDDVLSKEQEEINKKQGKKVTFSLLEFIAFSIRSRYRFASLLRKIKQSNTPYYYLTYESMFDSDVWKNVITFLKIKTTDLDVKSTFEKQNKGSLISRFSNVSYARSCCKILIAIPFVSKFIHLTSEDLK